MNQLISIADIQRAAVIEFDSLNLRGIILEVIINLDSLNLIAIDGNFQVVANLLKGQIALADTFTKNNFITASGFCNKV